MCPTLLWRSGDMVTFGPVSWLCVCISGSWSNWSLCLHVAGEFGCVGQRSVWRENSNWPRQSRYTDRSLRRRGEPLPWSPWSSHVWTQHFGGKFEVLRKIYCHATDNNDWFIIIRFLLFLGLRLHQPSVVDREPLVCLQGDRYYCSVHAATSSSSGETCCTWRLRPAGGLWTGPVCQQPGWLPAWLQPAGIQPGSTCRKQPWGT